MIETDIKKLFPNTSTVAYYSPFGQHIVLNTIEEKEYENAIKSFFNPSNLNTIKTISHELRHWRDHHTTLWGVNNLVDIYNAINARLINQPENFHYVASFIKNAKKSDLTEYYHTKQGEYNVKKGGLLWRWTLSIGSRFDHDGNLDHDKPIPFIRFLNPENGNIISRTPLSNSSLLETNAICEEIKIAIIVLSKLEDSERIVEIKLMESDYFKWLYNQNLTLYSAVAHLTSSLTGVKDVISSFQISNEISNLLLNLPERLYDSIPVNPYLNEFGEKNQLLKSQKSNGYTFLNLLLNYVDKYKDHDEFEIDNVLDASGLPNRSDIEKQILIEFEELKNKVFHGPFERVISKKIENAIKYFRKTGLGSANKPVIDFLEYEKPTLIFGDTLVDDSAYDYDTFVHFVFNGIPLTNTGWFFMHQDIYKRLETFYNICGI
jgi:hypothetical protein